MLIPSQPVQAATFTVNHAGDTDDVTPGDGTCADSLGNCTLRAAIREANALAGADVINFDSSLNGTTITLLLSGNDDLAALGDLDITQDLTINGNGASNTIISGGNIDRVFEVISATVVFNDLTITGGSAATNGAGIYNFGNTTLNRVRITGNNATNDGGGIYNISFGSASLTINQSTLDANTAGQNGGGIRTATTLNMTNSTISGNNANGSGGGIYVDSGTTTLTHVTVANNLGNADSAGGGNGGGVNQFGGTLNLRNSIVADNNVGTGGTGRHCSGTITSLSYNLIEGTTGCTVSGGSNDLTGDPALGALANNGGPTQTHALGFSSIAIDHVAASDSATNGCGTTYTTDQRNLPRPTDGNANATADCDIGAYEAPARTCSIAANSNYTFGNVQIFVQSGGLGNIGCLQASEFSSNHPNATTNLQTGTYWQLDALTGAGAAATGYTVNLTIAVPFTPDANDKLCRYTGTGWDCAANSFTTAPDTITRNNITQLSPWTGGNDAGPTAVTLKSLTARAMTIPLAVLAVGLLAISLLVFTVRRQRKASN